MSISIVRPNKWTWKPPTIATKPLPLAFFPLWEGSGTTITDVISGRTATLSSVSWGSDAYGGGLKFDGTHYVTLPQLSITGNCTVTFGFSAASVSGNQGVVALIDASNNADALWAVLTGSSLYISVGTGGSNYGFLVNGITAGAWYDFIVVKGAGVGVDCYYSVNGGSWQTVSPSNNNYGAPAGPNYNLGYAPPLGAIGNNSQVGYLGVYGAQVSGAKLTQLQADPFADLRGDPTFIAIGEIRVADGGDLDPTANGQGFIQTVGYSSYVNPSTGGAGNMVVGAGASYAGYQVVLSSDNYGDWYCPGSGRVFSSTNGGASWIESLPGGNQLFTPTTAPVMPAMVLSSTDATTATFTAVFGNGVITVTCTDSAGAHVVGSYTIMPGMPSVADLCTAINGASWASAGGWKATPLTNVASSTFGSATTGVPVGFLSQVTAVNCQSPTVFNALSAGISGPMILGSSGTVLATYSRNIDLETGWVVGRFGTPPYYNGNWGPEFVIAGTPATQGANMTVAGTTTPATAGTYVPAGTYGGYPYYYCAAQGTYLAAGASNGSGQTVTHWVLLQNDPLHATSSQINFIGPLITGGTPAGVYTNNGPHGTGYAVVNVTVTANTGSDQYWYAAGIQGIQLADGRWMIPMERQESSTRGNGWANGYLISTAGATQTQLMNNPADSASAAWTFFPIGRGNTPLDCIPGDNEISLAQLANGQILAVQRNGASPSFSYMSLGTIGSTGAITWADPTDSTNAVDYCLCDGGVNSSNSVQRPLISDGNCPVSLCAVNNGANPLVYVVTGTAPYSLNTTSPYGNTNRDWLVVSQISQAALTSSTAPRSIPVRVSPFGTLSLIKGIYTTIFSDNGTICLAVGSHMAQMQFVRCGGAVGASSVGGGPGRLALGGL